MCIKQPWFGDIRTQFVLGEGTKRLRVTVDMKAEYSDI